tara:strand:- start:492 stop:779 length:288 start_codon:yes stop_codon:yes gene_type:complete
MSHENFTGRSALWIKGDKAKPFKELMLKIAKEVGGLREAKVFIPISGKTMDLVYKLEVSEGTGRRIIDANNRIEKTKKKEAYKKLADLFNQGDSK